jgi:hypothetical protein
MQFISIGGDFARSSAYPTYSAFDIFHVMGLTTMNSTIGKILFFSVLLLGSGCQTPEGQYSTGQNGPVDCANFRIQSVRSDLKPDREKSCWISTAPTVEHVATGCGRAFEADTSYMIVSLDIAGTNTMMNHREPQAVLRSFTVVKNGALDWEESPSVTINDKTYKLTKFSLDERKRSCIGFVNYGNSVQIGYRSILYGYSCMSSKNGKMPEAAIVKDLEALRVRI